MNKCEGCLHKQNPAPGDHCYMFHEETPGDFCGQRKTDTQAINRSRRDPLTVAILSVLTKDLH